MPSTSFGATHILTNLISTNPFSDDYCYSNTLLRSSPSTVQLPTMNSGPKDEPPSDLCQDVSSSVTHVTVPVSITSFHLIL